MTLCDMMVKSLTVAQAQLGEELTREECNYHLGLRLIFSGSAQNTLETLTEIL